MPRVPAGLQQGVERVEVDRHVTALHRLHQHERLLPSRITRKRDRYRERTRTDGSNIRHGSRQKNGRKGKRAREIERETDARMERDSRGDRDREARIKREIYNEKQTKWPRGQGKRLASS